jgi:hypothetical protein
MSGTATQGEDYILSGTPGQATIQAGHASVAVRIKALTTSESGSETAIMTIQPGTGYRPAKNAQGTVTIIHP